jgi:hypothetical protein
MIFPKGFLSEFGCSAKPVPTSVFVGAEQRLHRGENYPRLDVGPNKQGRTSAKSRLTNLWGSKMSHGIDCSGLVQISLEAARIATPRDTNF